MALNTAFLLFDANNSGDISEDEMVQIIRAAVDFKPDNDQLKEMMDKFRSNDTPIESSTRSSAEWRVPPRGVGSLYHGRDVGGG